LVGAAFPEVEMHCFEPGRPNYRTLLKATSALPVTCVQAAVSDQDGTRTIPPRPGFRALRIPRHRARRRHAPRGETLRDGTRAIDSCFRVVHGLRPARHVAAFALAAQRPIGVRLLLPSDPKRCLRRRKRTQPSNSATFADVRTAIAVLRWGTELTRRPGSGFLGGSAARSFLTHSLSVAESKAA
jgi:hypothetical protein